MALLIEQPLFEESVERKVAFGKYTYKILLKYTSLAGVVLTIFSVVLMLFGLDLVLNIVIIVVVWTAIAVVLVLLIALDTRPDFQLRFYRDFVAYKNDPRSPREYNSRWEYKNIKGIQILQNKDTWFMGVKVSTLLQINTRKEFYDNPDGLIAFLREHPDVAFESIEAIGEAVTRPTPETTKLDRGGGL